MSVDDIVATIAELPADERRRVYAEIDALRARPSEDRPTDSRIPSAHDRARHLAGTMPGPADLSTDKAYLRGFGESASQGGTRP